MYGSESNQTGNLIGKKYAKNLNGPILISSFLNKEQVWKQRATNWNASVLSDLKPEPLSFLQWHITNVSRKSILLRIAATWVLQAFLQSRTDVGISEGGGGIQRGINNTNDAHVPNFVRGETFLYADKPFRNAGEAAISSDANGYKLT
jgi:hypothetical protein